MTNREAIPRLSFSTGDCLASQLAMCRRIFGGRLPMTLEGSVSRITGPGRPTLVATIALRGLAFVLHPKGDQFGPDSDWGAGAPTADKRAGWGR
jgi:hypothetical protein